MREYDRMAILLRLGAVIVGAAVFFFSPLYPHKQFIAAITLFSLGFMSGAWISLLLEEMYQIYEQ